MASYFFFRFTIMLVVDAALAALIIILFKGDVGNGWGVVALAVLALLLLAFIAEQVWLKSLPADKLWGAASSVIAITTAGGIALALGGAVWLAGPIRQVSQPVWLAVALVIIAAAVQAATTGRRNT